MIWIWRATGPVCNVIQLLLLELREVILLSEYENLPWQESATILDCE